MAFKQSGGFRGNDHKGGYGHSNGGGDRPRFANKSFGGGQGGFGNRDRERAELFAATCTTCGKGCEVPFRPSGDRPVFCKDCFGDKRTPPGDYGRKDLSERIFPKRDFAPTQSSSYAPGASKPTVSGAGGDASVAELKRQLEALHKKLDKAMEMIASMVSPVVSKVAAANVPAAAPAPVAEVKEVKKVEAAPAPVVAPAKSAPAKAVAAKSKAKAAPAKAAKKPVKKVGKASNTKAKK